MRVWPPTRITSSISVSLTPASLTAMLQGEHVLGEVDALVLLEFGHDVVDEALVEVLAAEEGVAVGGEHLELLLALDVGDLDERDVERAAAQVVDGNLHVLLGDLVLA